MKLKGMGPRNVVEKALAEVEAIKVLSHPIARYYEFYASDPGTNQYTKVFVGAMRDRQPGAVEIIEPEHTKGMLVCILQDYPNRTAWDDYCLMKKPCSGGAFCQFAVAPRQCAIVQTK